MSQRGVTLVELVMTIVIVGIAAAALMLVFTTTVSKSADPMIQEQAQAIAEAYMEEVLLRPFTVGPETTPRSSFDDIFDYNGLTGAPADQFGTLLGLPDYTVSVSVTASPAEGLVAIPGAAVARINVTVTHTSGLSLLLTGYRTDY